jgi:lipopolysaccharide heptosyltransferase II
MIAREHVKSVLVVKLSSIGDVVQSLPVAAALRRGFPRAYIAWAVGPAASQVVAGNPHLSETLVVGGWGPGGEGTAPLPGLGAPRKLRRALRERGFELSLDMQGLLKSALVAYLSGARERIGYRNRQEGAFLLNNRSIVPDRRDIHAVEAYLGFAAAVGAPAEPLDFTIATGGADRRAVDELLGGREGIIALIPGARWLSKRWPPARFAAVADALWGEFGCASVVVGGGSDGLLAQEIAAAARSPILDLTGRTTLKQLAELFRRCRAVISNETGPMYIASAVGAPTVAIFGPTDPLRLGPYGEGHAKVTPGVACAPCRRRECSPLRCMEAIRPEQVIEAARGLMVASDLRVG